MRPEQGTAQSDGDATVHPDGQLGILRHARQRTMNGVLIVEHERRERRGRRHDRVAEPPGDRESGAIASRLGQRLPAGVDVHMLDDNFLLPLPSIAGFGLAAVRFLIFLLTGSSNLLAGGLRNSFLS